MDNIRIFLDENMILKEWKKFVSTLRNVQDWFDIVNDLEDFFMQYIQKWFEIIIRFTEKYC